MPKVLIIVITIVGTSLLVLNVALIACFVRRRHRKRLAKGWLYPVRSTNDVLLLLDNNFRETCLRKKTEGYFLPFWLGSHNHISISANSVKVWTFFTSIFKVSKSSLHMSAWCYLMFWACNSHTKVALKPISNFPSRSFVDLWISNLGSSCMLIAYYIFLRIRWALGSFMFFSQLAIFFQ